MTEHEWERKDGKQRATEYKRKRDAYETDDDTDKEEMEE